MALAEEMVQEWRSRLQKDCPKHDLATHESIVHWLLGKNLDQLEALAPDKLEIAQQAMDYRYRILIQRYLGLNPDQAYHKLIQRLSSLFLIRNKIRTWIALSRDRKRTVTDVLQEVIQEMLHSDNHLRQQVTWIAQCTQNPRLRNALMLTSIEEYCLRPIRNQPLLVYRFVNYLRRLQRGGMTQVPGGDLVRLVSEEITTDEDENALSLLDVQAISEYQEQQVSAEQQALRNSVKQEFADYLAKTLSPVAAEWLGLYLQGYSQEAIAKALDLPIKNVYRLREKISYHAGRVFALKTQPELVTSWLRTSLKEHNLGLTSRQWQQYWDNLTPDQRQLIENLKAGRSVDAIAQELDVRSSHVMGEWCKLYLNAQALRSAS
ncbi:MAG: HetZ-related protein 2 [Cyanothece sp. SIO1E1]|nr:HetZ-related protein 2 [Cyanothece sp. SIO1E1]